MLFIRCPKCRAEFSTSTTVCPSCGFSLPQSQAVPAATTSVGPPNLNFFGRFWGILTAPRTTFGRILEDPRRRYAWVLVFLTSFLGSLFLALEKGKPSLLVRFPFEALFLYSILWFHAWLYTKIGRWLGGVGTVLELFEFCTWNLTLGVIYPLARILGDLGPWPAWRSFWGVVDWGLFAWAAILYYFLLCQVHRYSLQKAIQNMVLNLAFGGLFLSLYIYIRNLLKW